MFFELFDLINKTNPVALNGRIDKLKINPKLSDSYSKQGNVIRFFKSSQPTNYTMVSIIIVNYNTKDLTFECLESIYKQTKDVEFQIILVDNASSDGSVAYLRKSFPLIDIIESPLIWVLAGQIIWELKSQKAIFCFC